MSVNGYYCFYKTKTRPMCTVTVTTEALQLEGTLNEKEGELLQNKISALDVCIT